MEDNIKMDATALHILSHTQLTRAVLPWKWNQLLLGTPQLVTDH
jgi:hypothetical protein